jgi:hypothetical protein
MAVRPPGPPGLGTQVRHTALLAQAPATGQAQVRGQAAKVPARLSELAANAILLAILVIQAGHSACERYSRQDGSGWKSPAQAARGGLPPIRTVLAGEDYSSWDRWPATGGVSDTGADGRTIWFEIDCA